MSEVCILGKMHIIFIYQVYYYYYYLDYFFNIQLYVSYKSCDMAIKTKNKGDNH